MMKVINGISRILKNFFAKARKISFSLAALWLVFISITLVNLKTREWENPIRIIQDDVHLYYIYLPAVFVYHDLSFGFFLKEPDYQSKFWLPGHPETGVRIPKMSMGMAMVYAPFFLFAHYIVMPLTGAAGGVYAIPYKVALVVASLLYLLLGLWLLRKLLLSYFDEAAVALTLVVVAFGTNMLWYVTHEPAMSHIFSFALILLMAVQTQRWLAKPGIKQSLLPGLLFGLIVLIRPTNIIFGMIILFMPGNAVYRFRERVQFILNNYRGLIIMIAGFLIVWAPQLVFWKFASGSWFYYTYGEEGFFFGNPQVFSSLFSWRKGWLVYTPLMLMAFAGLPLLYRKQLGLFNLTAIMLVLLIWVNASWWCWWFGGSFGNRAYIDGYGIFAFGVAALAQAMLTQRFRVLRVAFLIITGFFVYLSVFQQWQYRQGLIHYDAMTRTVYFNSLFRTTHNPKLLGPLIDPDHIAGMKGIYYPLHEISRAEKQERNKRIMNNLPYLRNYLKDKATRDAGLMQSILRSSAQKEDTTRAAEVWAEKEIFRIMR
jgi:hypothetical protein